MAQGQGPSDGAHTEAFHPTAAARPPAAIAPFKSWVSDGRAELAAPSRAAAGPHILPREQRQVPNHCSVY